MSRAECEILRDAVPVEHSGILQIADIRVDTEPRRIDHPDILHRFCNGVHERRFHCFKGKHHTCRSRQPDGLLQALREPCAGLRVAWLIIDIVAGQLDDRNADLCRKIDGFFHDLE